MTAAAFVDRDGVVNQPVWDSRTGSFESPYAPGDVTLVPGAAEGLSLLRDVGFKLVIVSNQPAAAKGSASLAALDAVHERVAALLHAEELDVDAAYYCRHHPDGVVPELSRVCRCRKPAPGLLLAAAEQLSLELGASWMLGDADRDVQAGQAAGTRTGLIEHPRTPHRRRGAAQAQLVASDLLSAAHLIVAAAGR